MRKNLCVIVPPPDILSSRLEVLLGPFIQDMKANHKTYLILVRGINKGTAVYLNILKSLNGTPEDSRQVGFYHRNTSQSRKEEIFVLVISCLKWFLNQRYVNGMYYIPNKHNNQ